MLSTLNPENIYEPPAATFTKDDCGVMVRDCDPEQATVLRTPWPNSTRPEFKEILEARVV
jgi:hypothetical protein